MRTKKPQPKIPERKVSKSPDASLAAKLTLLKSLGVESFQSNKDGGWAVTFAPPKDREVKEAIVGFNSAPFERDAALSGATEPLTPAGMAAAQARLELIGTAHQEGIAPDVLASVEAAALQFSLESGLADPREVALHGRIDAAKTDEERAHYEQLLSSFKRDAILYAHSA